MALVRRKGWSFRIKAKFNQRKGRVETSANKRCEIGSCRRRKKITGIEFPGSLEGPHITNVNERLAWSGTNIQAKILTVWTKRSLDLSCAPARNRLNGMEKEDSYGTDD